MGEKILEQGNKENDQTIQAHTAHELSMDQDH